MKQRELSQGCSILPPAPQKSNISEWAEGELRGKTAKTWFSMVLGGGKVKLKLTQLISEWAEGELREKKLRLWDQKNMQNLFLGQLGAQYKMWIHSSDTFKNHYQLKNPTVTKSNLLPVFTLKTRIRKWLLKVTWCHSVHLLLGECSTEALLYSLGRGERVD